MQIVHQASLSALGLGVAFTVVWGVADPTSTISTLPAAMLPKMRGRWFSGRSSMPQGAV